ncbi:SRPBCC domain-containing protein [Arthrobacter sp. B10-11]|uniref:SRPBCC family protein n=1 Tax=Arthrobacter sp. B10-11 TaxID=3081160 RepID=UPI0029550885|nr:SRPBCC domain-containing protein [Arthrobacter sp. B10-11]MDV8146207.1 SRPBCC domain-containing protein [Arthrobacter sp. B10-11]
MEDQIKDARASVLVDAPRSRVWQALTDPDIVRQYFLGTQLTTTWQVGEPVTFAGEWKGKSFQDKGIVLENRHEELLRITHYSPLTGLPDEPENYHTVEYRLDESPDGTRITITQGNNKSESEAEESAKLWEMVLGNLKELLER